MDDLIECEICGRLNTEACPCQVPGFTDTTGVFFDISESEVADYLKTEGYPVTLNDRKFYQVRMNYNSYTSTANDLRLMRKEVHVLVNNFSKGKILSMRGSDIDETVSNICKWCGESLGTKCGIECCGNKCCCLCSEYCRVKSSRCKPEYRRIFNLVIIYDPMRHKPKMPAGEKNRQLIINSKINGWILLLASKYGSNDCIIKWLPKDVLLLIIHWANGKRYMRRRGEKPANVVIKKEINQNRPTKTCRRNGGFGYW